MSRRRREHSRVAGHLEPGSGPRDREDGEEGRPRSQLQPLPGPSPSSPTGSQCSSGVDMAIQGAELRWRTGRRRHCTTVGTTMGSPSLSASQFFSWRLRCRVREPIVSSSPRPSRAAGSQRRFGRQARLGQDDGGVHRRFSVSIQVRAPGRQLDPLHGAPLEVFGQLLASRQRRPLGQL